MHTLLQNFHDVKVFVLEVDPFAVQILFYNPFLLPDRLILAIDFLE